MEHQLISEGKCLFCEKTYLQRGIGKHLAAHLQQMSEEAAGANPVNYCHVEVKANEMFLHLLVKGNSTMTSIDRFLKDIWLECCGHMSNFGRKNFDVSMNSKVQSVFRPGAQLFHDYDYGSTTRVFLKGHSHYKLNFSETIILLSRNEPLKLLCASCNEKPATSMCIICQNDEYAFFCDTCSEDHAAQCEDFADYAEMPVVNSPRMGVCGYTGGSIDRQRDGVYTL